ncbi:hypothetical protein, partial [Sicyoidochytrium minutum DNA virus]
VTFTPPAMAFLLIVYPPTI